MTRTKNQKELPLESAKEKFLRLLAKGHSREEVWRLLSEDEQLEHPFAVYDETDKQWTSIREAVRRSTKSVAAQKRAMPKTAAERELQRLSGLVVECWELYGKVPVAAVDGCYAGMSIVLSGTGFILSEVSLEVIRAAGAEWARRYPPAPPPKFLAPTVKEKKETSPEGTIDESKKESGVRREKLYDFPVTSVVRWMGREGMSFDIAKKVLEKLKISHLSDTTVRIQLKAGEKGERGAPAQLTEKQEKELWDFAE